MCPEAHNTLVESKTFKNWVCDVDCDITSVKPPQFSLIASAFSVGVEATSTAVSNTQLLLASPSSAPTPC